MPIPSLPRVIRLGPALGLLASAAHLAWESINGGVQSHHLLARPDLPAVSNWWGLVLLPLLGWLASRRAVRETTSDDRAARRPVLRFMGALLVGLVLSSSFAAGFDSVARVIFLASLAVGLILPIYRAEYIFGFVLGMSFVVGPVLPTIAALLGAAISAVVHFAVRPGVARLFRGART